MRQVKQVYLRGLEIQHATVMLPKTARHFVETFLNCQQIRVAQVKIAAEPMESRHVASHI